MRRTVRNAITLVSAAMLVLFVVSCEDDDIVGLDDPDYSATLLASNEPPPANAGTGSGTATFEDEGDRIDWTLSVTGLTGITDSHIHLGASGVVGGIIINLFTPRGGATGPVNGLLGTGSITAASNPTVSLDSLRVLFNNGNSYVNVHTTQFGPGAIRGQVVPD